MTCEPSGNVLAIYRLSFRILYPPNLANRRQHGQQPDESQLTKGSPDLVNPIIPD